MGHHSKLPEKPLFFLSTVCFVIFTLSACTLIPETDPDRSAATVDQDPFGDNYASIRYLKQNWNAEDSNWF